MGAAAFAEGATTGVSLRLLESQGADADVLEVVGGERLRLVQVEGRTAAGCRLAAVANDAGGGQYCTRATIRGLAQPLGTAAKLTSMRLA